MYIAGWRDSALVLHETDKDTLADFLHCTDTRDNYEAQLLTGKKQLLDAELLSAKKDEAPQLLLKSLTGKNFSIQKIETYDIILRTKIKNDKCELWAVFRCCRQSVCVH